MRSRCGKFEGGGILITGILRIYFIREKNFAHNFA